MKEEYKNLEVAAEYNIGVAKYFPMHKNPFGLNKEEVKNFGYFLESVRDGKYLINDYPTWLKFKL